MCSTPTLTAWQAQPTDSRSLFLLLCCCGFLHDGVLELKLPLVLQSEGVGLAGAHRHGAKVDVVDGRYGKPGRGKIKMKEAN